MAASFPSCSLRCLGPRNGPAVSAQNLAPTAVMVFTLSGATVYIRICIYCMYVYVLSYLSVLHVYNSICMYMHVSVCMCVHVRIVRIRSYLYVFLMDIYLDTCRYEQILSIRTYTYIRTGYVQCANVRRCWYFCVNTSKYVIHFYIYVRIRTTWFTDVLV